MKLTTIITLCLSLALVSTRRHKRRRYDPSYAMQRLQEVMAEPHDVPDNINCDQAMDELLLKLPAFGSMFYALLNGWYLGQWSDYSSCLADADDSQYILATVTGNYTGPMEFTRGGIGKFTDGFTTRMGLCFPKQCSQDEVAYYTNDLIKGYAEGVGWQNVVVDYHLASEYDDEKASETQPGTYIILAILLIAILLMLVGTCVEMSRCGDRKEVSDEADAQILYEAAKFRRLKQYDAILLQRKTPQAQ